MISNKWIVPSASCTVSMGCPLLLTGQFGSLRQSLKLERIPIRGFDCCGKPLFYKVN